MAQGFGQLFQSASQALGIVGAGFGLPKGITSQLGLDAGGLGAKLQEQVNGETDEQRRRRLRDQQTGAVSPGGAVGDLFGGMGGLQY